jgi:hypothetical protein
MTTELENNIIQALREYSPLIATIKLTKTMLDKHIIDANASVRKFSRLYDVDYDTMTNGDKVSINAQYEDGTPCKVNFYRTKARSDRRASISGIKKQANVGDTIAITLINNDTIIINVSRKINDKLTG